MVFLFLARELVPWQAVSLVIVVYQHARSLHKYKSGLSFHLQKHFRHTDTTGVEMSQRHCGEACIAADLGACCLMYKSGKIILPGWLSETEIASLKIICWM